MSHDLLTTAQVAEAAERIGRLRSCLSGVMLDQDDVVKLVTVAVLARGHVLLEGLPGLGKTELCKALAKSLGLPFRRIQFTPDLLPGDVTGTYVLEGADRTMAFRPGPVFANVVLADEINRASPKTQAALLEAMQERSVTVLGHTHLLPSPFFVLATQNPIELEGTYPLPEAQLDRFMFRVDVPTVQARTMEALLTTRIRGESPVVEALMSPEILRGIFVHVDQVHLAKPVANYIARLVEATNPTSATAQPTVTTAVRFGASPRAAIAIASAARALALASGRPNVSFDDVRAVAPAALSHRLVLSYEAASQKMTAARVVSEVIAAVGEVPRA